MSEKKSDRPPAIKQKKRDASDYPAQKKERPKSKSDDIDVKEKQQESPEKVQLGKLIGRLIDQYDDSPLSGFRVKGSVVEYKREPRPIGSAVTDQQGLFTINYGPQEDSPPEDPPTDKKPSARDKQRIRIEVFNLKNTKIHSAEVNIQPNLPGPVDFHIAADQAPEPPSPEIESIIKRMKLKLPKKTLAELEGLNIHTLADWRGAGGLRSMKSDHLSTDDNNLQTLEAHANLNILSADIEQNDTLIEKGYTSIFDIARTSRSSFVEQVADKLDVETAAGLHVKADAQVGVLNNILTGLRVNQAAATRGTEAEDTCKDCESAFSPTAYFADLVDYTLKYLKSDHPDYKDKTLNIDILSQFFHQPFADLPVSSTWVNREVRQIRITVEVLRSYIREKNGLINDPQLAQAEERYLRAAYDTLLKSIGTSFAEMQLINAAEENQRSAIAERLGIDPIHFTELALGARDPEQLTEAFLDRTFGLPDTTRNPLSTGAKMDDSENAIHFWMVEGVYWNRNTDENGTIWGTLDNNEQGVSEIRLFKDSDTTKDQHLIASGKRQEPEGRYIIKSENSSGITGRIDADNLTSTFSLAVVPRLLAWRMAHLRRNWLIQDWPDDPYTLKQLPIIDPDLIGPADMRNPETGNSAFDLWSERREKIDEWLSDLNKLKKDGLETVMQEVLGDHLQYLHEILTDLKDGNDIEAAINKIRQLHLTVDSFTRLMEIKAKDDADKTLEDEEWEEVFAILVQAKKKQTISNPDLLKNWHAVEYSRGIILGPEQFWIALHEEKPTLRKWLASQKARSVWQQALMARGRTPMIDPDLIDLEEVVVRHNSEQSEGKARYLWVDRDNWLKERQKELSDEYVDNLWRMLANIIGTQTTELKDLAAKRRRGEAIAPRLAQLNLSFEAFDYLLHMIRLQEDKIAISSEDLSNIHAIMIRAQKQRKFATWRNQEGRSRSNQAPPLTLGPDFFNPGEKSPQDLPAWRADWRQRRDWEDQVRNRMAQEQAVIDGLIAAVDGAEEAALPILRNIIIESESQNEPGFKWIEENLLIDPKMAPKIKTTRLSLAIETVQALVRATRQRMVGNARLYFEKKENFDDEWTWMGAYGNWRVAMFVFLYPEVVLLPTMRPEAVQTSGFQEVVKALRSRPRVDSEAVDSALNGYVNYLKEIRTMEIQAESFGVHFAYSSLSHSIFWRGGSRKTAGWKKIPGSYDPNTGKGNIRKIIGAKYYRLGDHLYWVVFALIEEIASDSKKYTLKMFRYSHDRREWDADFGGDIELPDTFAPIVSLSKHPVLRDFGGRYHTSAVINLVCPGDQLFLAEIDPYTGIIYRTSQILFSFDRMDQSSVIAMSNHTVVARQRGQHRISLFFRRDFIHETDISITYFLGHYSIRYARPGTSRIRDYHHIFYSSGSVIKYDVIEISHDFGGSSHADSAIVGKGMSADFLQGDDPKFISGSGYYHDQPDITLEEHLKHWITWHNDRNIQYTYVTFSYPTERHGPQPYQYSEPQIYKSSRLKPFFNKEIRFIEDLTSNELQEQRSKAVNDFVENGLTEDDWRHMYRCRQKFWTNHNWIYIEEVYYVLPILVALKLAAGRHYRNALNWFRHVYDYLAPLARRQIYPPLDWEYRRGPGIPINLSRPEDWLNDPLNPHNIAVYRDGALSRNTLLSLIQCFLDYADDEYTRDTAETLPRAKEFFQAALSLLDAPDFQPLPLPGATALKAINLTNVISHASFAESQRQAKDAWEQALMTLSLHPEISYGVGAIADHIDSIHRQASERDLIDVHTFHDDQYCEPFAVNSIFDAKRVETNDLPNLLDAKTKAATRQKRSHANRATYTVSPDSSFGNLPIGQHAYCIPENTHPLVLRLRAKINLHKLRHGRNIAGLLREIDPYSTEIDLVEMGPVVGAVLRSIGGVLAGAVNIRPTQYRYQTLIARAKELITIAQQMEASFLTTLEKRDQAAYTELQARQDMQLTRAGVRLQELQVQTAQHGITLAELQQERAQLQADTYQKWIKDGLNKWEESMIQSYEIAGAARVLGAFFQAGTEMAQGAISAAGSGPLGAAAATLLPALGLMTVGRYMTTSTAAMADTKAAVANVWASFERRKQEWELQKAIANHAVRIGSQQKLLAQDQVRIARQERNIAGLRSEHAQTVADFLVNQRFTNAELYDWMSGILEGVYSYFLQQATAVANLAENQLAFERHEIPQGIILADYWAPPSEDQIASGEGTKDRRGLTGSARLLRDIYQLDQYRFETEKCKLQLTKTISLSQLAPEMLQRFRESGFISFSIPMEQFDSDFPGHYLRLIKRVYVSVVALIPPAAGIHATLSSTGLSHVVIGDYAFYEDEMRRDPEQVALTSPQNATGLFELTPQTDELLLPFEGNGVDMGWEFRMPKASNQFDFDSIADVLLTMDYTALDSDIYRQQVMARLDRTVQFDRAFSFKQHLPDQFYLLHHPNNDDGSLTASFEIRRGSFPPNVANMKMDKILLYFSHKDPDPIQIDHLSFIDEEGNPPLGGSAQTLNGLISTSKGNANSWIPILGKPPMGKWELALPKTISQRFKDGLIEDILFIISFSGEVPEWPSQTKLLT